MKYFFILFIISITLLSCKKSDLNEAFDCDSSTHFSDTKKYQDVLKHFKIKIPKKWKTNLYYDDYQSEIYSADTTKQLTETYIVDLAWHQGELEFNPDFIDKVKANLKKEHLEIINSGYGKFKKLPMYFNYSKGVNLKYNYHYLQLYIKYKPDEYYLFITKFYGDKFINERICESISLFENVKFNK